MNRKLAPHFILILAYLNGCGGGGGSSTGSGGGGGGGGGTPPPISVNFLSPPQKSVIAGGNFQVSATVTNDSANAGVNWSCSPTGTCGSFSANSTASNAPTVYTAPNVPPAGGQVTITATSVTDSTKNVQGPVTITPITVSISTLPPTAMAVSSSANVIATTNDPSGVNWSCMPAGACGLFSVASTPSGGTTTYTAPGAIPGGGTATLIATSFTDPAVNAQATVTINMPIVVSLSTLPPATLATSGTASVAATVTNDTANAGVTWSCTPATPAGACGIFSPTSTASGAATTYTAPASPPSTTGGQVTIIATSVTDTTKTAVSSPVTITGSAGVGTLKGQYAFLVISPTGDRGTATWAGSVNLDGTSGVGKVVAVSGSAYGGVEDVVSPTRDDQADPILVTGATTPYASASGYIVDASGHGTLTMSTVQGETLVISFVLTSASHAEVIEADGNPGSGTMDLQNPTAFSSSQITGTYSFATVGINAGTSPQPEMSIGGVFTISGTSISGAMDVNTVGASFQSFQLASGTLCQSITTPPPPCPDANGRGEVTFITGSAPPNPASRTFIFYIVSSKVLRIFENDGISFMGGSAYSQGAASAALTGNYAYQYSGWSSTNRTVAAGQFAATSAGTTGTISGGISDANAGASAPTVATIAKAVSGSYTVSTTENGTVSLTLTDAAGSSTLNAYAVDPTLNILDPNNPMGGGGALLMHTGTNINGMGVLVPQQTATPFIASYAVNLTHSITTTPNNEFDLVGVLTGDGLSAFGGTDNLADYDQNASINSVVMLNVPISGNFTANSGRYTGSMTVTAPSGTGFYPFVGTATPSTFNVSLYQASISQAFVVETDTQATVTGRLVQQVLP